MSFELSISSVVMNFLIHQPDNHNVRVIGDQLNYQWWGWFRRLHRRVLVLLVPGLSLVQLEVQPLPRPRQADFQWAIAGREAPDSCDAWRSAALPVPAVTACLSLGFLGGLASDVCRAFLADSRCGSRLLGTSTLSDPAGLCQSCHCRRNPSATNATRAAAHAGRHSASAGGRKRHQIGRAACCRFTSCITRCRTTLKLAGSSDSSARSFTSGLARFQFVQETLAGRARLQMQLDASGSRGIEIPFGIQRNPVLQRSCNS